MNWMEHFGKRRPLLFFRKNEQKGQIYSLAFPSPPFPQHILHSFDHFSLSFTLTTFSRLAGLFPQWDRGNVSEPIVLTRISGWEGQWRRSNGYHYDCLCGIKMMEKIIWKASWFQSKLTFQQSWRTYWSKHNLCLKRQQIWLKFIRFPLHSISLSSLLFPHLSWSLDAKE